MFVTQRLELHEVRLEHRMAFQQGGEALSRLLGVTVPADWPEFPEAFALPDRGAEAIREPVSNPWPGYLFVDRSQGALIGNGGYAGPPNEAGEVEVGYEVAPRYRNMGYASEAVRSLVANAFRDSAITRVIAHTLAEENASVQVLRKVGFQRDGEVALEEGGSIWRWKIDRAAQPE